MEEIAEYNEKDSKAAIHNNRNIIKYLEGRILDLRESTWYVKDIDSREDIEIAVEYYHNKIKRIKSINEFLNLYDDEKRGYNAILISQYIFQKHFTDVMELDEPVKKGIKGLLENLTAGDDGKQDYGSTEFIFRMYNFYTETTKCSDWPKFRRVLRLIVNMFYAGASHKVKDKIMKKIGLKQ